MGNCIGSSRRQQREDGDHDHDMGKQYQDCGQEQEWELNGSRNGFDQKGGLRVKIMLTKEELEWLMLQLKVNDEGKKLEEFLQEIESEREKAKIKTWKPSLESIEESPEGLEM